MKHWTLIKLKPGSFEDPDTLKELEDITTLRFSPTGDYLATGNAGGKVSIYKKESETYELIASYSHNFKSLTFLPPEKVDRKTRVLEWAPSPLNKGFLLSTNDATLRLWRFANVQAFEPLDD